MIGPGSPGYVDMPSSTTWLRSIRVLPSPLIARSWSLARRSSEDTPASAAGDIVPVMQTSHTVEPAPTLPRRSAPRMGGIEVVCGPMFCGKSEELIRRLRRSTIARYAVVCVKPSIDDRHGVDDVISHAGSRISARAIGDPRELLELRGEADVVGIDEAQFFDHRLPQ